MVGGGKQDPFHYLAMHEVSDLHHAGVKFTADFINGGTVGTFGASCYATS